MGMTIRADGARPRASTRWTLPLALGLAILLATSDHSHAQGTAARPILSGPLVKLDIKPAEIVTPRGKPQGMLTVAQHFALDPGWLNPLEHSYVLTQQHYDYIVHDALIKAMPQGDWTYSLAEHAEMSADYRNAAFRLRAGLKFQDGTPLTTADVKWTFENYKAPAPSSSTTSSTGSRSSTTARSSFASRKRSSSSWTSIMAM
jgi:ABC-type transport system substrate-binding protein